jgi:hypothetical protein
VGRDGKVLPFQVKCRVLNGHEVTLYILFSGVRVICIGSETTPNAPRELEIS